MTNVKRGADSTPPRAPGYQAATMKVTSKRPPEAAARSASVPAEFDDPLTWVAWLYYADQLTQTEIADILKVSRATVVKLLQDARERGIVTIRLNIEASTRTQLSRAIAQKYGLEAVHLIPALRRGPLPARLGDAGARVLADLLRPGDIIGVAWGRTVLAVAKAMPMPERPEPYTVVQICGSSPGGTAEFSPELCSSLLASRLSARCANLLAPAVLSSAKLRDQLLGEPSLVGQFKLIRSANRIVFGIGDLGPSATVRASELVSDAVIDSYIAKGAVGVVIGRFVDAEGHQIEGELDDRMVGVNLKELKTMPGRLCVAGGREKIVAIRAVLKGGYVNRLVTDVETAGELLK